MVGMFVFVLCLIFISYVGNQRGDNMYLLEKYHFVPAGTHSG